jgi:hypothetical protein
MSHLVRFRHGRCRTRSERYGPAALAPDGDPKAPQDHVTAPPIAADVTDPGESPSNKTTVDFASSPYPTCPLSRHVLDR